MKVGSIVEHIRQCKYKEGIACLKLKQPYTVRGFIKCSFTGREGIYLEEANNPCHPFTGREFGYPIENFRELLPPMEIQDALDSCEPVLIQINQSPNPEYIKK